ncbi:MAG: hypothetical protein JJD98_20630, partial [Polaromonas sp.]|nr:hypothetical protein [Polaromonas sp.]
MLPLTKGSSLAVQFSRFGDLPAVIDIARKVPIADGHDLEDLTFVVSTRQARAVIQFSGSDFPIGGQQRSGSRHRSTQNSRSITDIHPISLTGCNVVSISRTEAPANDQLRTLEY